jgi:hypothetical protein
MKCECGGGGAPVAVKTGKLVKKFFERNPDGHTRTSLLIQEKYRWAESVSCYFLQPGDNSEIIKFL